MTISSLPSSPLSPTLLRSSSVMYPMVTTTKKKKMEKNEAIIVTTDEHHASYDGLVGTTSDAVIQAVDRLLDWTCVNGNSSHKRSTTTALATSGRCPAVALTESQINDEEHRHDQHDFESHVQETQDRDDDHDSTTSQTVSSSVVCVSDNLSSMASSDRVHDNSDDAVVVRGTKPKSLSRMKDEKNSHGSTSTPSPTPSLYLKSNSTGTSRNRLLRHFLKFSSPLSEDKSSTKTSSPAATFQEKQQERPASILKKTNSTTAAKEPNTTRRIRFEEGTKPPQLDGIVTKVNRIRRKKKKKKKRRKKLKNDKKTTKKCSKESVPREGQMTAKPHTISDDHRRDEEETNPTSLSFLFLFSSQQTLAIRTADADGRYDNCECDEECNTTSYSSNAKTADSSVDCYNDDSDSCQTTESEFDDDSSTNSWGSSIIRSI